METRQLGNCTLYLGDCMDVLPTLKCVDAVVTDPPYGIGVNHNMGRRSGDARSAYAKADWDVSPPPQAVFDLMFACCPHQIIWGANHFMDLIRRRASCWLVWDKMFSPDVSFASCELAWTSIDGVVRKFTHSSQRRDGVHPTQKPLPLMQWCLTFLPDAKTIADPFMGSGTTGLACIRAGKSFIGIEKDPHYFQVACERIERELAQLTLPLK